jgi:hypothetical protein
MTLIASVDTSGSTPCAHAEPAAKDNVKPDAHKDARKNAREVMRTPFIYDGASERHP